MCLLSLLISCLYILCTWIFDAFWYYEFLFYDSVLRRSNRLYFVFTVLQQCNRRLWRHKWRVWNISFLHGHTQLLVELQHVILHRLSDGLPYCYPYKVHPSEGLSSVGGGTLCTYVILYIPHGRSSWSNRFAAFPLFCVCVYVDYITKVIFFTLVMVEIGFSLWKF